MFVSHNPSSVATICDRAIILYKGRVVFAGHAKDVMSEYLSSAYKEDAAEAEAERKEAKAAGEAGGEHEASAGHSMAKPRTARSFVNIAKTLRQKHPMLPTPWLVLKWVSLHALDGEQKAEFSTGDGVRIPHRL